MMKRSEQGLEREIQQLKVLGLKEESLMPEERSLDVHSFYPVSPALRD